MKAFTFIFLILSVPFLVCAQNESAGTAPYETMAYAQFGKLIDNPTAGTLSKGDYDFEIRIFPEGGILGGFMVGLFPRLSFGISYGGSKIIGNSPDIEWNDEPGVEIKYRLSEEGYKFPAIAIGYSNQGYGAFIDSTDIKRYMVKSKGIYGALSKNFTYNNRYDFSLHLGLNYNTSEQDDDDALDFYTGLDFIMNEEISILGEYDFALNDNNDESLGEKRGYLNAGLRWTFAKSLILQVNFKDILGNYRESETVNRELMIVYRQEI